MNETIVLDNHTKITPVTHKLDFLSDLGFVKFIRNERVTSSSLVAGSIFRPFSVVLGCSLFWSGVSYPLATRQLPLKNHTNHTR